MYADFTFLFGVCWQTFYWLIVEDAKNCRNDPQDPGDADGGRELLRGTPVV